MNMVDQKLNRKIWCLNNLEKIYRTQQQYKADNEEKLKETFICPCGSLYTFNHRARHFKTKKHVKFIKSLNLNSC